jgi:hypothetical protein
MLDAIKALFFNRRYDASVFNERGGRVTVISIYSENVH